jgi:hypothetical protein
MYGQRETRGTSGTASRVRKRKFGNSGGDHLKAIAQDIPGTSRNRRVKAGEGYRPLCRIVGLQSLLSNAAYNTR